VFIWRSALPAAGDVLPPQAAAGTIARTVGGGALVATGDGWLRIVSVQRDGEPESGVQGTSASWLADGRIFA
jgi:methionyl-tRNA formyltransferase